MSEPPTPSPVPRTTAEAVTLYREGKGLSKVKLAEKAHVSLPTIIAIEKGTTVPRRGTLEAIAKALDLTYDHLSPTAPATQKLIERRTTPHTARRIERLLLFLRHRALEHVGFSADRSALAAQLERSFIDVFRLAEEEQWLKVRDMLRGIPALMAGPSAAEGEADEAELEREAKVRRVFILDFFPDTAEVMALAGLRPAIWQVLDTYRDALKSEAEERGGSADKCDEALVRLLLRIGHVFMARRQYGDAERVASEGKLICHRHSGWVDPPVGTPISDEHDLFIRLLTLRIMAVRRLHQPEDALEDGHIALSALSKFLRDPCEREELTPEVWRAHEVSTAARLHRARIALELGHPASATEAVDFDIAVAPYVGAYGRWHAERCIVCGCAAWQSAAAWMALYYFRAAEVAEPDTFYGSWPVQEAIADMATHLPPSHPHIDEVRRLYGRMQWFVPPARS